MTGIIILAAGESSRLGKPKQNLLYQGKTLLQHALSAALNSRCKPVIVVLGAYAEVILPQIKNEQITIFQNPDWHEGMASSIRLGIAALEQIPAITNALITLCDQPFVDSELINHILQKQQISRKGIIACAYKNTLGVPVLFNRQHFPELMALNGHEGAKKLLAIHINDIASVPFAKGVVDVDTMADYEGLMG